MRLVLAVTLTTCIATNGALQGQASGGSSSSRVASPTVVATYRAHDGGDGTSILDLLVLWRGSPGWFMRVNGASSGSGLNGGFGQWYSYQWASYSGITLMVEYDSARNTAKIRDREISLNNANVVLIDGVDSSNPTFLGTQWIDPSLSGTGDPVPTIMKRSPELFEFLRCDLTLPDPAQQMILALICGQMRP